MTFTEDPSSVPKTEHLSLRIDAGKRVLLERATARMDDRLGVFVARAILEAAEPLLPRKQVSPLSVPNTSRSPNAMANVAAVSHALAARLRKLSAAGRTWTARSDVYASLSRATQDIAAGRQPPLEEDAEWLRLPAIPNPPEPIPRRRLGFVSTEATAARLGLVAARRGLTTREAVEQVITEKLTRHNADGFSEAVLAFPTFPPLTHLNHFRSFADTAMPLCLAFARIGPKKNAHYTAAAEELGKTLRGYLPKLR